MHPTKFRYIWPSVSEKILKNRPIRGKNGLWWPCLLTDQKDISNRNRGLSIDASYQVSVHLAKQFQRRRIFLNQPIRNKNRLWWPCLLMDRDGMSNLYRGPSMFRFIWPNGYRNEEFLKSANQKQVAYGGHVC